MKMAPKCIQRGQGRFTAQRALAGEMNCSGSLSRPPSGRQVPIETAAYARQTKELIPSDLMGQFSAPQRK